MATETAEIEKDEKKVEETVDTSENNDVQFDIELDDDAVSEVEKSVLEANKGKAKDELAEEIESAKKERIEKLKEEAKPVFDKIKELSEKEENKDKSPEELHALAVSELKDSDGEGGEEGKKDTRSSIFDDEDFVAIGRRKEKEGEEDTTASVELPDDIKSELEEYRKLKEDKVLSAFLEAKKSGSVSDFDELYRKSGLHIDPKAVPADTLYRSNLLEMQKLDPTITKEEIDEKVEAFSELDKFEKNEKVAPLRARLEQEQRQAKESFFGQIAERSASTKVDASTEITSIQDELKGNYLGKRFFGVDVDEKVVDRLVSNYRKGGIRVTTPDGKLDVGRTVEAQLITENLYDIIDAAVKRSAKDTSRKEAVKRGKPYIGFKVKGITPKPKVDPKEALQKAIESRYLKR